MYITLEQGEKIPMGNFSFVGDAAGNRELAELIFQCEACYLTDYMEFAKKLRGIIEALAMHEEIRRRKSTPGEKHKSEDVIRQEITEEIGKSARPDSGRGPGRKNITTYKGMLYAIAVKKPERFIDMLDRYHFLGIWNVDNGSIVVDGAYDKKEEQKVLRESLKSYIYYLYAFGSKAVHGNEETEERFRPTAENCRRIIWSFHDFLSAFYQKPHRFQKELLPVQDYIPVPMDMCEKMGFDLGEQKRLYVKEQRYYILSKENTVISLHQKREADAIHMLWEQSYEDPANVIRSMEKISCSDKVSDYQVLSLPGRPISLTPRFIKGLSEQEKLNLIQGVIRGVRSMHTCEPPVYHRNLNPGEFLVVQINGRYKILLSGFSYSKKDAEDSDQKTVYYNLIKKAGDSWNNDYFAPELRKNDADRKQIRWDAADIFSLGQLMIFILTGYVAETVQDVPALLRRTGLKGRKSGVLADMLSWYPEDRPNIKKVADTYL